MTLSFWPLAIVLFVISYIVHKNIKLSRYFPGQKYRMVLIIRLQQTRLSYRAGQSYNPQVDNITEAFPNT